MIRAPNQVYMQNLSQIGEPACPTLVRNLRTIALNYADANIVAVDETAVWKDMLSSTTVDKVGSKIVLIKTTGHEKEKVTICLAAKADGEATEKYDEWLAKSVNDLTPAGNPKAPPRKNVVGGFYTGGPSWILD